MTGFTPGPWHLFHEADTTAVMTEDGREVVHWRGFDASHHQLRRLPNARLIAAAPELYEALSALMRYSVTPAHNAPLFEAARAALRKDASTPPPIAQRSK